MTEQEQDTNSDVLICRKVVRRFLEGDSMLEVLSGVDLNVAPAVVVRSNIQGEKL